MMTDYEIEPKCPICGSKGYVGHDVVDGFDFGWSSGCPRFCLGDGIHGYDRYEDVPAGLHNIYCSSKDEATQKWADFCQRKKGAE